MIDLFEVFSAPKTTQESRKKCFWDAARCSISSETEWKMLSGFAQPVSWQLGSYVTRRVLHLLLPRESIVESRFGKNLEGEEGKKKKRREKKRGMDDERIERRVPLRKAGFSREETNKLGRSRQSGRWYLILSLELLDPCTIARGLACNETNGLTCYERPWSHARVANRKRHTRPPIKYRPLPTLPPSLPQTDRDRY